MALGPDRSALALWVLCGSWCGDHLTDGHVPSYVAAQFGTEHAASELVRVGLWDVTETGYRFHDWEDMQPSRVTVTESRRYHAEKQQRYRDRKRLHAAGDHSMCDGKYCDQAKQGRYRSRYRSTLRNGDHVYAPTRPDPTRRVGEGEGSNGRYRSAPEGPPSTRTNSPRADEAPDPGDEPLDDDTRRAVLAEFRARTGHTIDGVLRRA